MKESRRMRLEENTTEYNKGFTRGLITGLGMICLIIIIAILSGVIKWS